MVMADLARLRCGGWPDAVPEGEMSLEDVASNGITAALAVLL